MWNKSPYHFWVETRFQAAVLNPHRVSRSRGSLSKCLYQASCQGGRVRGVELAPTLVFVEAPRGDPDLQPGLRNIAWDAVPALHIPLYIVQSYPHLPGSLQATSFFLNIFNLNLLGWLWLVRSHRFQVNITVIHGLCTALCAHRPKSNHLLSPSTWPPRPFTTPHPTFLWQLPYCCLCLWVSVFYPTYEWNHRLLSLFWLTYFT